MNPLKLKFLPISFGISLFGLFFSVWNILSFTEEFCLTTTSCLLFSEFAILGISFWWFGALFFTMSLILALFGLVYFGKILGTIGVILDFILLCIMFYTMPCANCLIIGFCIAATYYSFCFEAQRKGMPLPRPPLLLPWGFVFIMICGNIFISFTHPWALYSHEKTNNTRINIYFSTGCSACANLIIAEGDRTDIDWYPVQEQDDDLWKIKILQEEMKKGLSFKEAYLVMKADTNEPDITDIFSTSHWALQFNLWKNAAHVSRSKSLVLPLIEFHGAPSVLATPSIENPNIILLDTQDKQSDVIQSLLGDVVGACGDELEPCPE